MKIIPNQTFKHGTESYEQGQEYEVDDSLGSYFEAVGWVGERESSGSDASLNIDDILLGHSSEVN